MIIEGKVHENVELIHRGVESVHVEQQGDIVVIDKHQAAQLIEALQRWVNGEEIE